MGITNSNSTNTDDNTYNGVVSTILKQNDVQAKLKEAGEKKIRGTETEREEHQLTKTQ